MMRPRLALTVGDPAGIGPEICAKAVADARVQRLCEPVLYGPSTPEALAAFEPGLVAPSAGLAAYEAIVEATRDAMAGRVDGLVTAPVNKEAFAAAGLRWKGHTDLLAHLTGTERAVMMFAAERLRVSLVTVHIPLADVPRALTVDAVVHTVRTSAAALPSFGAERCRIAVAGLNPHAGEHGVMGTEEADVLQPAIDRCRADGVDVVGPLPGDTVFVRALAGEFDLVVACYHDQGLIPVKLLGFGKAVNVTLGLPIVRTSVDHGTAFDIAGTGRADPGSLIEAIALASRLVAARAPTEEGAR